MIKFFVSLLLAFAAVQASAQSGMCDSSSCNSPNGVGGFDCWAGTKEEPCTCSMGNTPEATGGQMTAYLPDGQEVEVYEYHCCDYGDDDETIRKGEECGDFKHFPIGLLIAIVLGVMCCCCIMIALFCKGVCVGLQACCGGGNKRQNTQVMPVAGGMVMPNANAGTMAQQQMMFQQQMAMQQQQMMMQQPQAQAPVITVVTNNN